MPIFNPPLIGDGHGIYRIHIVGNSGSGKSTLGAYLSTKLNVPHIPLDEIFWKPGWQTTQANEFNEKLSALMAQNTRGWIVDGDYQAVGTLVLDNATDIIWLDPPLRYYLPRLLWRTFMRILGFHSPCAQGCEQTWGDAFSKEGIIWYCLTNHAIQRTKYTAWLSRMSTQAGGKMVRLDESRGELARWKDDLEEHLRTV
ncbi:hypothetical protein OG21DRAFT_1435745 [Imleria badia]|nr:hypothetical protein OG21DRAFT_1435745 [Imleria badia]